MTGDRASNDPNSDFVARFGPYVNNIEVTFKGVWPHCLHDFVKMLRLQFSSQEYHLDELDNEFFIIKAHNNKISKIAGVVNNDGLMSLSAYGDESARMLISVIRESQSNCIEFKKGDDLTRVMRITEAFLPYSVNVVFSDNMRDKFETSVDSIYRQWFHKYNN